MCFSGDGKSIDLTFRRIPEYGGAELSHARFSDFSFRKHAHDRVGIGIVTNGAMQVNTPRKSFIAEPGILMTVNPDTVHWGSGVGDHDWEQHILMIDEASFAETVREMTGRRQNDKFVNLSLPDPALWRCFQDVHGALANTDAPLARGELLLGLFADVVERSGVAPDLDLAGRNEPRAVTLARTYIDTHFAEPISLDDLAVITGISTYRLSRAFRHSVGIPPHAYQMHRRVRAAEWMLRQGNAPAEVATDCGFSDQAHLTRVFRQATGITPAQFRAG